MMHAINDFLTTDYGLMSLAVIAFCVIMPLYIATYIGRKVRQDAEAHERALREGNAH